MSDGASPVPAPAPTPTPTHRREITVEVFEEGDEFRVVGRLRDDRPWAAGSEKVEHVHDMVLTVRVRRSDCVITAAHAEMRRFPHEECPGIEAAFGGLVGLGVTRGYTRAVQERFGRSLGCTHLEQLARAVGPVVVQAMASAATRLAGSGATEAALHDAGAWFADSCHVWAATGPHGPGPGMQKVAMGWRPGGGEYPAPAVETLRRRAADGET